MWVPPEDKDPVLLHAPTRKSVALFGAVCLADGRLATLRADVFDAVTFRDFLCTLVRRRRRAKKMIVVLDNARYHYAAINEPWVEAHKDVLELSHLPPYSPELNPVERVWKLTRRICTHNHYFPNLEDLIATVQEQFGRWRQPNETLHRLCAVH